MKQSTNTPFADWINSIPVGEYAAIRARIIQKCYISRQNFNQWKNGKCNVPPLAQEKINEIAGYEVFKLEEL